MSAKPHDFARETFSTVIFPCGSKGIYQKLQPHFFPTEEHILVYFIENISICEVGLVRNVRFFIALLISLFFNMKHWRFQVPVEGF